MLLKAAAYAAEHHREQVRKDASRTPYVNHVVAVADMLASIGQVDDTDMLCAALLHDVVEDTDATLADVAAEFGDVVAGLVAEVTDDKSLAPEERKRLQVLHAPSISLGAQQIKLADKIANLYDLIHRPPVDWTERRRDDYRAWARRVAEGLRGCNAALERVFDQVAGGRAPSS